MSQPFRFKQFLIEQGRCAMKVNTDAILLGSWAGAVRPEAILDIGTGTGVIALMLAQRFPHAMIDAVEIDPAASDQAAQNFNSSPWADRLKVDCSSIQTFGPDDTYDLIVSNPPYFQNGEKPNTAQRTLARHDVSLTLDDLVTAVKRLLSPNGRFSVVLPVNQSETLLKIAAARGLLLTRQCVVRPTPQHPPKRMLLELANHVDSLVEQSALTVETQRHQYSPEYCALAREFLLKM